jgi:hypothetical protein
MLLKLRVSFQLQLLPCTISIHNAVTINFSATQTLGILSCQRPFLPLSAVIIVSVCLRSSTPILLLHLSASWLTKLVTQQSPHDTLAPGSSFYGFLMALVGKLSTDPSSLNLCEALSERCEHLFSGRGGTHLRARVMFLALSCVTGRGDELLLTGI